MIIYHPANDINHCAFRLVTLLSDIPGNMTAFERLKILDFYYLFPHFLVDVKLPRNPIISKQALKKIERPYESLPSPRRLMFQLKSFHSSATRSLVAKGIIDKEHYLRSIIKLDTNRIPNTLLTKIREDQKRVTQWYKLLTEFFISYPLDGKDGLKGRTQLVEYRYDTV